MLDKIRSTFMEKIVHGKIGKFMLSLGLVPFFIPNPDLNDVMCNVVSVAKFAAYIGAFGGLILYGVMKVYEVINPGGAGQGRDALKNMAFGLILIAIAVYLVPEIFSLMGISVEGVDISSCQ